MFSVQQEIYNNQKFSDPILWVLDQFMGRRLYADFRQSPLLIMGKIRWRSTASNSVVTLSVCSIAVSNLCCL